MIAAVAALPFDTATPTGIWIVGAALLGFLAGRATYLVITRMPEYLERNWNRDARAVLGLDDTAPPASQPPTTHSLCPAPVEVLTGIASAIVVWRFGATWQGAAGLVLTWVLIAAAGVDMRSRLLPDVITLPLLWAGLLASLLPAFTDTTTALLGAAAGYLALWAVYWACRIVTGNDGIGHGDFKLLAATGAWFGWAALLPIVLIASLTGAAVSGVLQARSGVRSSAFAFGPFLAIAAWAWMLGGTWASAAWQQAVLGG